MIWADRLAIAVYALVAFGMALMFATSDAPLREAAYKAKAAKFAEDCAAHAGHDVGAPDSALSRDPLSLEPGSEPQEVRLPDSLCDDSTLKAVRAADAATARAPTIGDLMVHIAEAGLFLIAPLWGGLRLLDIRYEGPRKRLARNPYWKSTHAGRKAHGRRRRQGTGGSRISGSEG